MKSDFAKIQREIDAMQPELARIRRDLHRCPETGWLEMRTTAILAKALRAMGYETYTGRAVCKRARGWVCRMKRFWRRTRSGRSRRARRRMS